MQHFLKLRTRRKLKKFLEALIISSGVILLWRGIWMIADIYLFPHNAFLSGITSVIIGILILILTESLVSQLSGDD
jgi:hypothetical protein